MVMENIERLREMVGFDSQDEKLIERHRAAIQTALQDWSEEFTDWFRSQAEWPTGGGEPLIEGYFESFACSRYDEEFSAIQYRQSLHWLLHGVKPSAIIATLSHIRHFFIAHAEQSRQMQLARALCRVVDMAQSIQSMVTHLEHQLARLRQDAERDIQRLRVSCHGVIPDDDEVLRSYIAHFQWKSRAYALALGDPVDAREMPGNHHDCMLGRWLDNGGIEKIPTNQHESLHRHHRRLHELMNLVLEKARAQQLVGITRYLHDIEAASTKITSILGECLDQRLQRLAAQDGLTGLGNKRLFEMELSRRQSQASRHGHGFGILFMDLDYFKSINDRFGHAFGDQVIREAALLLKGMMRGSDTVYRWGGEEFAALIGADSRQEVQVAAERLRDGMQQLRVNHQGQPIGITLSIGASWCDPLSEESARELFLKVDQRLNRAKRAGRNQVVMD